LKNSNLNGFNALVNNLYPMILFFSKNIEFNKELQSLIYSRESITTYKLKLFIIFISLIKVGWFKAFQEYTNLENPKLISNFYFWKKRFFLICLDCLAKEKKLHIIQKLFNYVVKSYGNCWAFKKKLVPMLYTNFKGKNKISICSELHKIAMLPKNASWSFWN